MIKYKLINGECIETMKKLPDACIDLILTDPPYGTTQNKWDSIIPLDEMWEQLNRIIKPNGAIVLTSQPFTSILVSSNLKGFKHEWIWEKSRGSNFGSVKYQPFKEHESVLVFSKGAKKVDYYPIKEDRKGTGLQRTKYKNINNTKSKVFGKFGSNYESPAAKEALRYPSSIQKFNNEVGLHPTQKPVKLMEYLIKTYTQENELVLDFTMGSGTTGVACLNTNRRFLGIELDEKYFEIAKKRIEEADND